MKAYSIIVTFLLVLSSIGMVTIYKSKAIARHTILVMQQREKSNKSDLIYKTIMIAYPQLDSVTMRYESVLVNQLSNDNNISWELIVATNFVESRFETHLVSDAGARGKMQLLDRTAKKKAADIGMVYTSSTLWNSISNMILGCAYLKEANGDPRYYVGGPDWAKSKNQKYIDDYANSINNESRKLNIISKGLNGSSTK